ncbi:MARVEL domain-containing protein 1 [Danio aesculapii]|uniref:MARVEL domain-containing protein 1 n=1 Tax=Danio aesculapii TaxID=1142201 RepID=UPI0024C060AD|nr:MARVEL domain-containing protein 1 [Danio aesculapii]
MGIKVVGGPRDTRTGMVRSATLIHSSRGICTDIQIVSAVTPPAVFQNHSAIWRWSQFGSACLGSGSLRRKIAHLLEVNQINSCLLFSFSSCSLLWKEGGGKHNTTLQRPQETEETSRRKSFQNPGAELKIHSVCTYRTILLKTPTNRSQPFSFSVFSKQPPSALSTRSRSLQPQQKKEEMPTQPQEKRSFLQFLKSFVGIVRVLQILLGAGLWVTIAANKYEGSIHFVLFVAVLFWLLTLAIFILTLLDKQDLVPIIGGERWLLSNLIHDVVATLLYLSTIGIMIYKTQKNSYCNLDVYKHHCLYKVYLTASVFACLTAAVYLLSGIYCSCRKCRGERTVV